MSEIRGTFNIQRPTPKSRAFQRANLAETISRLAFGDGDVSRFRKDEFLHLYGGGGGLHQWPTDLAEGQHRGSPTTTSSHPTKREAA